jgi:molybdopterin molybdotransferase
MVQVEEAQNRILSAINPSSPETVPVKEALGRFLSEEIVAHFDLPQFDNSAMDGYAIRAQDVGEATSENPATLDIVGQLAAGEVSHDGLQRGQCIRIFTGSALPKGADAVIPQEETRPDIKQPGRVLICQRAQPWENVRFKGEDVQAGACLAHAGERVGAGMAGLLAASGRETVKVHLKPVVGLLSTGSELREAGQQLDPGQIYESNRVMLAGLILAAGAQPRIYPLVRDDLDATRLALNTALDECDAVISSGGVSVGEMDFVKQAFTQIGGSLNFWQVAMKPGKPFVFGTRGRKLLFGLPGNPVSAFVTFLLLARPALLALQSAREVHLRTRPGRLAQSLVNRGDRRHFLRVQLSSSGDVRSAGAQASHLVSSLARANGLVDLPPQTSLPAGATVTVLDWEF